MPAFKQDSSSASTVTTLSSGRPTTSSTSFAGEGFEDEAVTEESRIDLLSSYLTRDQRSPTFSSQIRKYARELKLWTPNSPYTHFQWDVSLHTVQCLKELPKKCNHSGDGAFDWIGKKSTGTPKWLWDSASWETVLTTPKILKDGYIAVSWTWGRYQEKDCDDIKKTRYTTGTTWEVPKLPKVDCRYSRRGVQKDLLTHLKYLLQDIPGTRYVWVDLLCIDQRPGHDDERRHEIAQQASIFSSAKCSIAYLWKTGDVKSFGETMSALGRLTSWCFDFGPGPSIKSFPITVSPLGSAPGLRPDDWDDHLRDSAKIIVSVLFGLYKRSSFPLLVYG